MTDSVVQAVARVVFLPSQIVALALLVKGYDAVGGGFSGGIVSALGFSLLCLAFGYRRVDDEIRMHWISSLAAPLGLALALGVTFWPAAVGAPIVTHFPAPGEAVPRLGTLKLHTAMLFDTGVFLLILGFSIQTIRFIASMAEREES